MCSLARCQELEHSQINMKLERKRLKKKKKGGGGMAGRTPTLSGSVLTFRGTIQGEEGENDLIEGSEERT